MKLVSAQCPACNAQLEIPAGLDRAFCLYCGSQVIAVGGAAQPAEFQVEAGVLVKYRGNETHVVIPSGVKEIGTGAFAGAYIDSVVLPEGLVAIGDEAFKGSTISDVNLPSTVGRIGIEAFRGTRITEAEIPAGATLCAGAFLDCAQLEHVTFAPGLKFVNGFRLCESLRRVEIPASVETVYPSAFDGCSSLSSVTFEPGSRLKAIGGSAFRGCALAGIAIPAAVEKIEDNVFAGCASLSEVVFEPGSKLKVVGYGAFRGCALAGIAIPAAVETIEGYAFNGCASLSEVAFEPGSKLKAIGSSAFRGCALTSIELPVGVEIIEREAFFDNPLKEFNYPAIKGDAPTALVVNGAIERITFHPECDLPTWDAYRGEPWNYHHLFTGQTALREVELNGVLGEGVVFKDCPSLEKVTGALSPIQDILHSTSRQSPLFKQTQQQAAEASKRAKEEYLRQQEEVLAQTKAQRRSEGKCQHCGGQFKGLVSKTCVKCGKKKDY